ncbi:MAG: hypothetical protein QXT45_07170 [Candidatus Bilamarchaeaceae archaeon]
MLIVAAVLSAEVPDTAGEILQVSGADITALQTGTAPINTEHNNPEDLHNGDKDFAGFNTIIGRVITAKKIYSEADCENEYELAAWNELQVPLIFGYLEFFDGPDAHENAKAAAALIRMGRANSKFIVGFSVEGQILKRDKHYLTETVIKRVAATAKPANKAAVITAVMHDSKKDSLEKNELKFPAPQGYTILAALSANSMPTERLNFSKIQTLLKMEYAVNTMRKALSAGSPASTAPSNLVQGAALQGSITKAELVIKDFFDKNKGKRLTLDLVKSYFPTANEQQLRSFFDILKQYQWHKYVEASEKAYASFKKTFNLDL